MPSSHRRYAGWTIERIREDARRIGPATAALCEQILEARPHPEQGYRACLRIVRLVGSYGAARVEAAAERAIEIGARTYGSVKSILENKLDRRAAPKRPAETAPIRHPNIRGQNWSWPRRSITSGGRSSWLRSRKSSRPEDSRRRNPSRSTGARQKSSRRRSAQGMRKPLRFRAARDLSRPRPARTALKPELREGRRNQRLSRFGRPQKRQSRKLLQTNRLRHHWNGNPVVVLK
jgi:hypothetical protein